VLLVEDNPGDRRLLQEALADVQSRQPFVIEPADTLARAVELLHARSFHAVLLDLSLPDSEGLETFTRLQSAAPTVPIIVLSGLDDEKIATEAVRLGAQDYLVKGLMSPELLNRSIKYSVERFRQEASIKESLKQKELLLKEIHHRVKNNLQVISSLLSLQSRHISNAEAKVMFEESRNRVSSMALVHEELYRSANFERIDFGSYIRTLAGNLFRSYSMKAGAVDLQVRVDPVHLNIDTAIPAGLIINELVSNSLKHAFPDGRAGVLSIDLKRVAEVPARYEICVADNGVGFPPDLDFRNSNSLGLELVSALADQLGASIRHENIGGTQFVIEFSPLKES
jgi:two-component sensor histidine kinase